MKKTQPPLLALRKEAMGQAGRAASPGGKRQRNEFSSRASRRECGPADPYPTVNLQNCKINLYCFKTLSLW